MLLSQTHLQSQSSHLHNHNLNNHNNLNNSNYNHNNHNISTKSSSIPLLLILNNATYTSSHILPSLGSSLSKLGLPLLPPCLQRANEALDGVKKLAFSKYAEGKSESIVVGVEKGMYSGHFSWELASGVRGVRGYVSQALLGIVQVIYEVSSVSEALCSIVVERVVETVIEELTRLFSSVSTFNSCGALQGVLDIKAFSHTVSPYLNTNSKALLKDTLALIPNSAELLKNKKVIELHDEYVRKSQMQYSCFSQS